MEVEEGEVLYQILYNRLNQAMLIMNPNRSKDGDSNHNNLNKIKVGGIPNNRNRLANGDPQIRTNSKVRVQVFKTNHGVVRTRILVTDPEIGIGKMVVSTEVVEVVVMDIEEILTSVIEMADLVEENLEAEENSEGEVEDLEVMIEVASGDEAEVEEEVGMIKVN